MYFRHDPNELDTDFYLHLLGFLAHHSLLLFSLVYFWQTPTFSPSTPVALPCRPGHFRCTLVLSCPDHHSPGPRLGGPLLFRSVLAWIFALQVCACAGLYFSGPCLQGSQASRSTLAWAFTLPVRACMEVRPPGLHLRGPLLFRSVLAWTFILSSVLVWP